MLSDISKIFDPMGWLVPVTLKLKLMMQAAWLQKIDWDSPLPKDISCAFFLWRNNLVSLRQISIHSLVCSEFSTSSNQLHVVCEASQAAYAACIYLRTEDQVTGGVQVSLLTSKSKVAPLKQVSLPRLELCAA